MLLQYSCWSRLLVRERTLKYINRSCSIIQELKYCDSDSVLLTTVNSDDLEIRVPDRSRSPKVTQVNSAVSFPISHLLYGRLYLAPFDRAHTTSYSSLIETIRLSCTVYEI